MNVIKKIIKTIFFLFFLLLFITIGVFAYFAKDLPDPSKISQREIIQSTKIYDRTGEILLYEIHGGEKRTTISIDKIPDYVKYATIVTEDKNFYSHIGIDIKAILRAALSNLKGKKITQGGSTITQQLIKNTILTPKRTFTRKIKEIILALELERKYSKDEILGFYLNQIYYGSNSYGIESAAETFFNKKASELTLAEAALLAALPKAPSYYSPYGSHFKELKKRQEYILDRMAELGYISFSQAKKAKEEKLKFAPINKGIKAPHFVMEVVQYLEKKYGKDYIQKAGLKVITTLDYDLQKLAEEIISKYASLNEKKYKATNAALVAIDPKTGQVLAMVGSKDYFDIENQGNFNVATSPFRQPGSSFKPFAYAEFFKKGYPPSTILFDLETNFGKYKNKDYIPKNYDNKYRGPISAKEALAQSINVPSVKVLYLAGIKDTIKLAKKMGITTLNDPNRYGLSLVLGGGEVKLIDEVIAYSVFAQEGIKHPVSYILKVEDSKGNILEKYENISKRVLPSNVAKIINDILSDENARAPMFGSFSKLCLPLPFYASSSLPCRPAGVKTGTTQDYADGWTIGYTPSLVTGVWAGNNDFKKKMRNGAGIYVAAPIWNEFMTRAYKIKSKTKNKKLKNNEFVLPKQIEYFNPPELTYTSTTDKFITEEKLTGLNKPMLNGEFIWKKKIKIDKISGKLATKFTPLELIEEKTYIQKPHCILYYVDKNNPLGEIPKHPEKDPQFENWEKPVLEWAKSLNIKYQSPPLEYDDIHIPENKPKIEIISPSENQSFSLNEKINIKVKCNAPLGVKQLDFFFDDNFINTDTDFPYQISFKIPESTKKGIHFIKIKAYDKVLNRNEKEVKIEIK